MARTTVLFVDNDAEFLQTWREFLEQEGYQVLPALDPSEARAIPERRDVDLAIVDVRLINDDDEKDISGLNLAKRVAPSVPKIILTRFATYEAVREALGPQLEGLPPAVDFVAKQDGPEALLSAVRKALSLPELGGVKPRVREAGYPMKLGASLAAIISLLLGIGAGIGAIITADPRWLLATVFLAILMVVGIGLTVFMPE